MAKNTAAAAKTTSSPSWIDQVSNLTQRPLWVGIVLLALSFILYGNTVGHDYALDDAIVITQNGFTQQGFAGLDDIFSTDAFEAFFKGKRDLVAGGRYRPLSIATYAIEYQLFGPNPHVSHFVNILLYGILGWVIFLGMQMLISKGDKENRNAGMMALMVSVLFLVHPIHTEVVANIKGRDEILAMLLAMVAFLRMLVYTKSGSVLDLAIGFVCMFLGALSKETALPFLAVIPFGMWFMGSRDGKQIGAATGVVSAAIGVYWGLRSAFAGGFSTVKSTEILNDPFIGATYLEQVATSAKTVVLYIGKLIFPATLSHDYYYNQVPVVGLGDPMALLGFVLVIACLVWGVMLTRKGNLAGFGLLFFLLTFSIVSNVVFPIGTTMGERFMFVPSLGFILAAVVGLEMLFKRASKQPVQSVLYFVVAVSVAFGIRTIVRNPVWKNDFVLFTTDVENSPNSAKMQTAAGGALVDEATKPGNEAKKNQYLQQAIPHLRKAVEIYPQHGTAWLILGNAHFNLGQYGEALQAYKQVIAYRPAMVDAYKNAGLAAKNAKSYSEADAYFNHYLNERPDETSMWITRGDNYEAWGKGPEAIETYQKALAKDPKSDIAVGKIGMVYGKLLGNFDQSIIYLQQAVNLNPKEKMHHENLGIALAMKGDPNAALAAFNAGLAQFPNDPQLLRNVGITYGQMGDTVTAQQYFARAEGR